jgi:hypothetical protein
MPSAGTAGPGNMRGVVGVSAVVVSGHAWPSQHPGGMGVAAGNRLGVGLGGDRRVRRYLSAIAGRRKPAAQAPDDGVPAGSQPAIPSSRERLLVRDGAEHRSAIRRWAVDAPITSGASSDNGRAALYLVLSAIPQLADDRNARVSESVAGNRQVVGNHARQHPPVVAQEPENRTPCEVSRPYAARLRAARRSGHRAARSVTAVTPGAYRAFRPHGWTSL